MKINNNKLKKVYSKAWILIILGILVASIPLIIYTYNETRTRGYINDFWNEVKEPSIEDDNKSNNRVSIVDNKSNTKVSKVDKKEKNNKLSGKDVIGIIEIPSLSLEYPIFEGTDDIQLNVGIGHMESTAKLNELGNCVLAGHNGSSRGTYFTYLSNIQIGEVVRITNRNKITHEYKVKEMKVVSPYDKWVTEKSDKEQLTLFTCANHGSNRFVVKCEVIE